MGIEMNGLCSYKGFEKFAIVDNSIWPIIGETLLKFW
jgi:hypothetical protein